MVTENILHNFRGYTYNITLKSVSMSEYNNAYNGGFSMHRGVVLKSSGKGQNSDKVSGATNLDYVVNRLELNSIMSYNRRTRTSNTTQGSMEIFEPYSMVFLEDLQAAARQAGFSNYLQAPYLLSIHFQPSTDHNFKNDANSGSSNNLIKHIPIRMTNITFEVNASGATYEMAFIPYNHIALMDSVAYTKIASTVNMSTLGNLKDLVDKLNDHELEYQAKENLDYPNSYEIHMEESLVNVPMGFFETSLDNPKIVSEPVPNATGDTRVPDAISGNSQYIPPVGTTGAGGQSPGPNQNPGVGAGSYGQTIFGQTPTTDPIRGRASSARSVFQNKTTTTTPVTKTPLKLTPAAQDISDAVAATVRENARVGTSGTQIKQVKTRTLNPDGTITEATAKVPQYNTPSRFDPANAKYSTLSRGFKFQAKEDILGIIDKVMQNSEYCTKLFEEDANGSKFVRSGAINNGKVDWYQVVPQVKIKGPDNGGNTPAHTIKYMIHKSTIDANLLVTDTNSNIGGYDITRSYDYLYTGKNDDIIDFRINYNNMFYQAMQMYSTQPGPEGPDKPKGGGAGGQRQNALANMFTTFTDLLQVGSNGKISMQGFNTESANPIVVKPGHDVKDEDIDNNSSNVKRAKHLADVLRDPRADLVELNMDIIGDPVYVLTKEYFNDGQKMGNRIFRNQMEDLGSTDGMTFINVNFKQPERGDINQAKGIIPVTKNAIWSGVYRLTTITNMFENGLFMQTLNGVRVHNQGQTSSRSVTSMLDNKKLFTNNVVEEKNKKLTRDHRYEQTIDQRYK